MVEVKNNRFYKRKVVSAGVTLFPKFKDFSKATDTSFYLNAGMNASQIVLSGSVPANPSVGGGELSSAYLQFYCTGMSLSGATTLPELESYLLQPGISVTEGGFEFSTSMSGTSTTPYTGASNFKGNKLAVYSAALDPDIVWMEENFDGSNKSFGTALIQDNDRGASSMKDLYISPQDGEDIIFAGGDAFFGGGASDDVSHNLEKYFSDSEDRVYIKPLKKNRIKGIWTSTNDKRNEKQKWQIYAPFWKWAKLQTKIKIAAPKAPPQGANVKEMPNVSKNNTIFNDLFASPPMGNILSTDTTSSPLLASVMEISSEKKASGGSSLKMHSLWSYISSTGINSSVERTLGRGKYNCQTIKAGMWNIPKPVPLDAGGFGYAPFSGSSVLSGSISGTVAEGTASIPGDEIAFGAHITDKRMSLPEINITMNIDKLYPSPAVRPDRNTSVFHTEGTIYYKAPPSGNQAVGTGSSIFQNSRGGLRTLWRSVVITWSSYKATGFDNLDDFIDYGMNKYYVQGGGHASGTQLCGLVFERLHGSAEFDETGNTPPVAHDTQDANAGNIYAYALPVTSWQTTGGTGYGGGTADTGLYANGGMVKFESGSNKMICHDPRVLTESSREKEPHWVELPENDFINLKVVFDVMQPWGQNTYSKGTGSAALPYQLYKQQDWKNADADDAQWQRNETCYGTPIMAFFDGCISGSNAGSAQLSGSENVNKPFIPIPLMCRESHVATTVDADAAVDAANTFQTFPLPSDLGPTGASAYIGDGAPWKTAAWPKHMTIWVNNYRYCTSDATSSSNDYIFSGVSGATNAGAYTPYRAADNLLYPSGALSPETTVYIDNIEFKYFNNEIINHSTTSGKMQSFINLRNPEIESPLITRYEDSGSAGKPIEAAMLRDMNREGTLWPRRTGMGVAIGFDDYRDLTQSLGMIGKYDLAGSPTNTNVGLYGYFLWNNFSTMSWDLNTRMTPTAAWLSVAPPCSYTTSTSDDTINQQGTGFGNLNRLGWQVGGTIWGNNGNIGTGSSRPTSAGAWTYKGGSLNSSGTNPPVAATSTGENSKYTSNAGPTYATAPWQGFEMWANGASGASLQSGGTDFHGGAGTNAHFVYDNNVNAGYAWVSISTETEQLGTTFTTPAAARYNTPVWDGECRYGNGNQLWFGQGTGLGDRSEMMLGMDGFTQKGFMGFAFDGTTGSALRDTLASDGTGDGWNRNVNGDTFGYGWQKRENIWASAKILAVPGQAGLNMADDEADLEWNAIIVDNPSIILPDQEDCEYVIYRAGHGGTQTDSTFVGVNAGTVGGGILKVCKLSMSKNDAQGLEGALYFDTRMWDLQNEPLDELWISPYKYWLNMVFTDTNNGPWNDATGFVSGSDMVAPLNNTRTYESICQVAERMNSGYDPDVDIGSTYNEWNYSYDSAQTDAGVRALITKPWILDAGSEQTSLIADKDFGYGAYEDESNDGGQLGKVIPIKGYFTDMDIGGLVGDQGVAPEEGVNIVLGLSNQVAEKSVELVGDDNATLDNAFLPSFIWEYTDELPIISEFAVAPAFDALAKDVNLYDLTKENVNNISFTWEEDADDVWYRMLIIDSKGVPDKYTNAVFWAPLNVSSSTIGSAPALTEYNMTTAPRGYPKNGTALTVGSTVRTKIDGLAGYAAYTTTDANGCITGTSHMKNLKEYTFVIHLVPSAADTGSDVWVATEGDPEGTGFGIKLDSGYVKAYTANSLVTSTTLLPLDGETPVSIMVTYKSGSTVGPDFKLYINGALEDYSASPAHCTATSSLIFGGLHDGSLGKYKGSMEEIIIYNKALPIIESDGEYLYNPSELSERVEVSTTVDKYITQHARLFVMDYHNIRGTNSDEVASSNQISWKVTTI